MRGEGRENASQNAPPSLERRVWVARPATRACACVGVALEEGSEECDDEGEEGGVGNELDDDAKEESGFPESNAANPLEGVLLLLV